VVEGAADRQAVARHCRCATRARAIEGGGDEPLPARAIARGSSGPTTRAAYERLQPHRGTFQAAS
jgi:hypothetical protein